MIPLGAADDGAPEAWIVVDLGFGDAGKGTVTDFLVRDRGADLVVRFNGGAQAGHNVVTDDGRHHTFSQFCAASFAPGARGLLGPEFLLHPWGMVVESEHLIAAGAPDPWARTFIDARAKVITPFQQAANRVRELARGGGAHGTCGIGVGECMADSLYSPADTIRAGDLADPVRLGALLTAQRDRKAAALAAWLAERPEAPEPARAQMGLFDDDGLIDRVVDAWGEARSLMRIVSPDQTAQMIRETPRIVFEGAQGVLLDEDWGFHPHTTWSHCTPRNAMALLGGDDRRVVRLGVHRAYTVRHGAGPFPTEGTLPLPEDHNDDAGWQGRFRAGALDAVLLRYALAAVAAEGAPIDALAITCLDRIPERAPICDRYAGDVSDELVRRSEDGAIEGLRLGACGDLAYLERLGGALRTVRPEIEQTDDLVGAVRQIAGLPVILESRGLAARDKSWRR